MFDRLSGSRRALNEDEDDSPERRGGALSKIRDLTKKTLRKGSRDEEEPGAIVQPRDSSRLFDGGRRATHSGLGNGSAATVRVQQNGSAGRTTATASPRTARRATASISEKTRADVARSYFNTATSFSLAPSRTVPGRALGSTPSLRSPNASNGNLSNRKVGPTTSVDSTKENLSRSSSSSNR